MAHLHNRRRQLAAIAEREAAGESFWTEHFDERLRTKIEQTMLGVVNGDARNHALWTASARQAILEDEGLHFLAIDGYGASSDFTIFAKKAPDDMMPTLLEAIVVGAPYEHWGAGFAEEFNDLLREHRISMEIIDEEVVHFASRELHVAVVEPVLRLLKAPGWEKVEAAYRDALAEIATGTAPDAITDAGTALQEALTLLGASGNALGPLIVSARKRGLFAGHDEPLLEMISRAATWVSADRSAKGDAHSVTSASHDDAWFAVHVVGALLLRLSSGARA